MIKYQNFFLKKIKSLLPYFVEFKKNVKILSKKYSSDFAVEKSNQQLIIIIIYDKNTFFSNNS